MSSEPTADRLESGSRLGNWFRRRGWALPVHVLLLSLALLNIYPFIWMMGTSTKTAQESTTEKHTAVPTVKYGLHPQRRESLFAPFRPGGKPIDIADLEQTERAKAASLVIAAERAQREAADPTLTPVQREILQLLREDDIKRRCIYNTFVPYRITPTDAAKALFPVGDDDEAEREQARAALADLADRDLLAGTRFQLENYAVVWRDMRFWLYTATSFLVTSAVVIIVVLMSSMLGFALARMRFPGKMLILSLLLFGAVAPTEAVIIPVFRFIMAAGLLESLWGMVLWMAGISIGNAFLMAGFFLTLPREVEEAAFVDGAGPFRTFFAIALPMARPIVMTVGLLAFLGAWNNFLVPLLTAQSRPAFQPLALAVFMFKSGYESFWHWINAAATLMVIPVVVLFIMLQRYIVNAIAVGAVKG